MVINDMYDKEHNTTEINTDLTAIKLSANASCVCQCVCRIFKQSTEEWGKPLH